ncbi:MAG: hypothetical protein RLY58_33 [Pseudomonadota bacterium]
MDLLFLWLMRVGSWLASLIAQLSLYYAFFLLMDDYLFSINIYYVDWFLYE